MEGMRRGSLGPPTPPGALIKTSRRCRSPWCHSHFWAGTPDCRGPRDLAHSKQMNPLPLFPVREGLLAELPLADLRIHVFVLSPHTPLTPTPA